MTIRELFLFLLRRVSATVAPLGRVVPAQIKSQKITVFAAVLVVGTFLTTLVAEAAATRGGMPPACDAATVADCSAENGESIGGVLPPDTEASCSSLQSSGFCDMIEDGTIICCSTNDKGDILDCKKDPPDTEEEDDEPGDGEPRA